MMPFISIDHCIQRRIKMRSILAISMAILFASALIGPSVALSDYQNGVLDGLSIGWEMAQKYDQALQGSPADFNQAVPQYNAWIEEIFGKNESLMLMPISTTPTRQADSYFKSQIITPMHSIDASWNQTGISLLPEPDAYGLIKGVPADAYYSFGPALADF
jgi:hypothetical protein